MFRPIHWLPPAATIAVCCVLLTFHQTSDASQRSKAPVQQPFANPVDQRFEMIGELKAIHDLLKEQNALLKEQNQLLRGSSPPSPNSQKR